MNRLSQILLTTTAISCISFSALANPLSGSVEVEVSEGSSDAWKTTTTLGLAFETEGLAFGGFNIESVDASNFTLDEWNIGTTIGPVTASLGKQGDIWVGAEGEHTIANMSMDESLIISLDSTSVALEFKDYKNDISEIESIALSHSLSIDPLSVTAAVDYDLDSENWTLGTRISMDSYGGVVTYGKEAETIAYEIDASMSDITVYVNGDEDEMLRNIGATYAMDLSGLAIEPKLNYDIDAEDLSPSISATLKF